MRLTITEDHGRLSELSGIFFNSNVFRIIDSIPGGHTTVIEPGDTCLLMELGGKSIPPVGERLAEFRRNWREVSSIFLATPRVNQIPLQDFLLWKALNALGTKYGWGRTEGLNWTMIGSYKRGQALIAGVGLSGQELIYRTQAPFASYLDMVINIGGISFISEVVQGWVNQNSILIQRGNSTEIAIEPE